MTTPPPSPPPLPSWASGPRKGVPAPGSPADEQMAAFIGPRWPTYRRKFTPFFDDPRFTPTWNWSAALMPAWFLYRKLYLPFAAFVTLPSMVVGLIWRDGSPPVRQMPNPLPGGTGMVPALTPDAALVVLGVLFSTAILAGGTANFLLFRRATAALRVVGARAPGGEAALALLRKVGGVSWQAVGVGVLVVLLLRVLAASAAP